ncbi:hypothetical protein RCL1_005465 [Eukaryota sp. TZLM3-RCL]
MTLNPLSDSLKGEHLFQHDRNSSQLLEAFLHKQTLLDESTFRVSATLSAFDELSSSCVTDLFGLETSPTDTASLSLIANRISSKIERIIVDSTLSSQQRLVFLASLSSWFSSIEKPSRDVSSLDSDVLDSEQFSSKISSSMKMMRQNKERIGSIHDHTVKLLTKTFENKLQLKEERIACLQLNLIDLLQNFEVIFESTKLKISKLESDYSTISKEFDSLKLIHSETEIKLQEEQLKNETIISELTRIKSELLEKSSEVNRLEQLNQNQLEQISNLTKGTIAFEQEIERLLRVITHCEHDKDVELSGKILDDLRLENVTLLEENSTLKEEHSNLLLDVEHWKGEFNILSQNFKLARESFSGLFSLINEIEGEEESHNGLEAQNPNNEDQSINFLIEQSTIMLQEKLNVLNSKISNFQKNSEEKLNTLRDLAQNQKMNLQETIDQLQSELTSKNNELTELKELISQLQLKIKNNSNSISNQGLLDYAKISAECIENYNKQEQMLNLAIKNSKSRADKIKNSSSKFAISDRFANIPDVVDRMQARERMVREAFLAKKAEIIRQREASLLQTLILFRNFSAVFPVQKSIPDTPAGAFLTQKKALTSPNFRQKLSTPRYLPPPPLGSISKSPIKFKSIRQETIPPIKLLDFGSVVDALQTSSIKSSRK